MLRDVSRHSCDVATVLDRPEDGCGSTAWQRGRAIRLARLRLHH